MVLITSWPKTNWKGTFTTRKLILTRNLQCLRPFFTSVFCLNFTFQFDCLLYFSVTCFNTSCLLKYEPNIDFLEVADGSVCEAITYSGPSSLCAEVYRTLVKAQKRESWVLNLAVQTVLTISHGHKGPLFRVWTQRGGWRWARIPLLGFSLVTI